MEVNQEERFGVDKVGQCGVEGEGDASDNIRTFWRGHKSIVEQYAGLSRGRCLQITRLGTAVWIPFLACLDSCFLISWVEAL